MNKIKKKRILSLLMAVVVALTGILPASAAFAGDGVEGYYDIELFYKETNTIVPSYIDDTVPEEERQTYIEYMHEGDELELTYNLIDTEFPNNGYVKWYSETPTLVDVTQEGVVKAFDSSKGAVVQTWIDNEVKTIPLVGKIMAAAIEKALFNEYVDIDTMDTEEIVNIVEGLFGEGSVLDEYVDSYKSDLIDSLRYYLDNINSNIHIQLFDANGTLLDDDFVQICVLKCEEWYANFLPNGTHITNKSQIPTTVAVGSTAQIYAVTTPLRLHYGCVYSVKSSSIFEQGKVVATVNDSGLVTFKNKGKVTIMVSPDTEQIVEGILKMVNYFYALENTGTLDTDKIAGILIDYVGIDMNRTVLAGILDVCFAIKDIAGDTADPVQLTATAVELIGNLVLQFVYNDTITFEVVDAQPLSDFSIDGPNSVKEGTQVQLEITDIQPTAGDVTDITWRSSDPSIASVDPETGVVTGRDAGGSLGNLSNQKCTIYAVSAANQVERSFTITVTGKTGKYLSDVEIVGKSIVNMEEETNYSYTVYPSRVAESDSLYITWGMITGEDEDGNPIYSWASSDSPVTDGIGTIDSRGHYTATDGGYCTIALKAQTGYYLSNGDFYEISSFIRTFEVLNGIPVESIQINITDTASNGTLNKVNTVTINGRDYTYATIHKEVIEGYYGNGAVVSASIYPANATNQTLRWVVDNGYYDKEVSGDTHSVTVTQKSNHEVADTFNVYAVSEDGEIASNVITVCITRNYATTNTIDQESIELINGKQIDATHTIGFKGSWTGTAYACYKCNWYSSDEDVFTVETKTNDNRDARITAHDVGTATLYCVSADGGIVDTCEVTVYPDKEYLGNIIKLCDKTVIKRTSENRAMYNEYMRKLDLAYTIYYDEPMASQTVCDTYARELLYAFSRLGGFIGIAGVDILSSSNTKLDGNHVTVKVGSTTSYTKYSYDFGYKILPESAMYSSIKWTSSNSNIVVDKNGRCTPASNDACTAKITCTVTDYLGAETSDSVYLTFARKPVTGVSLDTTNIVGGKIGETQTLKATVSPTGVSGASCTDVLWTTSNPEIATVDSNGVVTFIEGGDCVIYCTTYDGGFTAQCAVNVVTNYTPLTLLVQQYRDLSLNEANYFPDTWQVFIDAMTKAQAMIDKGGHSQNEVDAMYAELEAAYNGLKKYNYIQKIELYLDGEPTKEFYQYDLSLLSEGISYKNAVLDLNVRLYPNNGSYASVEWKSSTSDISVTSDGKCSPTINSSCYGMITCTVTDHFGNKFTDSVWVSYSYYPVTKLELSETNISGLIGETYQLACTVYPTGTSLTHIGAASIQDYFWESDNPAIASIDSSTGLVTFVSAGATVVRAVSYDGGVSAECIVSTEGDRSYLKQKLDEYKDVDHTQYAYDYGMTFVAAKQQAEAAMTDKSLSQEGIDSAAEALVTAYEQMILNPYIKAQSIDLNYTTYKRNLVDSSSSVASGNIGTNDALSINLSSSYSNYNDYNDVKINAAANPSDAMYKSIVWTVDDSKYMNSSVSNSAITLTPTSSARDKGAWAQLTVTITDDYDRTVSRTISVVMADSICTGFDITESTKSVYATDTNVQIAYTLSGSTDFTGVKWTSSDESVLTVDSNGVVTPIEKGTATVTGKTVDGGFSDSIAITVYTDFSTLASKQNEYYNLVQNVKDSFTYTEDSLDVLAQYVAEAQTMINEGKATQAEVNQMIENLDNAYNSLVPYIPVKGVSVGYNASAGGATEPNNGFIRYTGSLLNGRYVKLQPRLEPEGSFYTTISWTSSNPNITVDENGVLTNNVSNAGVTEVTCTVQNIHGEIYTASAYVSFVRYGTTSVSFADERVFGAPAQTVALSPTIKNSNNSNVTSAIVSECIYETSNPEIATVDENGVVTFITQGEAVITATALDGGYSATINAYTTWDTTALKAAIDTAAAINYKDYAYDYGTAFNTAYQNALTVYNNVYATQAEIDEACTVLTEATTALEGHEFIAPVINLVQDTRVLGNTDAVEVDVETQTATVNLSLNEGAMVQSSVITVSEAVGVTATVSGNAVEITKTEDTGSLKIAVAVTDDYGKTTTKVYSFSVINEIITATSIALTVDGAQLTSSTLVRSCGGTYTNFKGLTIGYVPTPADANAIKSVTYSSSASNYITIDSNGAVALTTAGKLASSNSTVITCTVTNTDGTTVTAQLNLTITRA